MRRIVIQMDPNVDNYHELMELIKQVRNEVNQEHLNPAIKAAFLINLNKLQIETNKLRYQLN